MESPCPPPPQPHGALSKVEKQIVHLCVPTRHDLLAWITGIRLAKVGGGGGGGVAPCWFAASRRDGD